MLIYIWLGFLALVLLGNAIHDTENPVVSDGRHLSRSIFESLVIVDITAIIIFLASR